MLWNNFKSWLPPSNYLLQIHSKQLGPTSKYVSMEFSFQIGYALKHIGLFNDCGFLHANVNFVHKSLFSPEISTYMELPRNTQWKQVYKHAFPVHPMPQPLLLTLTQGVRTELVLDARELWMERLQEEFYS